MGRDVLGEAGVSPEIGKMPKSPEVTNFEIMLDNALSDNKLSKEEQADIIAVLTEAKEAQKEALEASLDARKEVLVEAIARRILIENDSIDTDDLLWNNYSYLTQWVEGTDSIWEGKFFISDYIISSSQWANDLRLMEKLGINPRDVVDFMNSKSEDEAYINEIKKAREGVDNTLRLLKAWEEIWTAHIKSLNDAVLENEEMLNLYKEKFIGAILEGYPEEGKFVLDPDKKFIGQVTFERFGIDPDVMFYATGVDILWMTIEELLAELNKRKVEVKSEVKTEVKPVVIETAIEWASDSINVILSRLEKNALTILETNALVKYMKENPELKEKIIDGIVNTLKVRYQGVKWVFQEDTMMDSPSIEFSEWIFSIDDKLMYFGSPTQIAILGKDFVARLNEGRVEEPEEKVEEKPVEIVDKNAPTFEEIKMWFIKDIRKDILWELDIKPGFGFEETVALNIVRYTNGKNHFDLFFKDGILGRLSPDLKEELKIKNREDLIKILNAELRSYLEEQAAATPAPEAPTAASVVEPAAATSKAVVSQSEKYVVENGEYTVKHKDDLATIVENIHGKWLSWPETQAVYREVARKSGIETNDKLKTGQKLKMLTNEEVSSVLADYKAKKQKASAEKIATARAELGKDTSKSMTYEVQSGDMLWNIAKDHYWVRDKTEIVKAINTIVLVNTEKFPHVKEDKFPPKGDKILGDIIKVGDKLTLPAKSDLGKTLAEINASEEARVEENKAALEMKKQESLAVIKSLNYTEYGEGSLRMPTGSEMEEFFDGGNFADVAAKQMIIYIERFNRKDHYEIAEFMLEKGYRDVLERPIYLERFELSTASKKKLGLDK